MIVRISIYLMVLGFLCCQPEGRFYVKHLKLSPDVEWIRKDVRVFKVPIEDVSQHYKVSLSFRYANGFQYRVAKVEVKEISPSHQEIIKEYSLNVRKDNGEYIGDPGFDIWDSEHIIEKNKQFQENGTYTYEIKHVMPKDPLYYAMEIGFILDEVK